MSPKDEPIAQKGPPLIPILRPTVLPPLIFDENYRLTRKICPPIYSKLSEAMSYQSVDPSVHGFATRPEVVGYELGAALLERRSGTEFQPLSPAFLVGNDEIRCLESLKPQIAVHLICLIAPNEDCSRYKMRSPESGTHRQGADCKRTLPLGCRRSKRAAPPSRSGRV